MYKVLFTDIDGTLLNKSREITPATKIEIQRITVEQNIPVILISSRMPKAMKHLHDELKLSSPIIAYNGALILKSAEVANLSDILFSATISSGTVRAINNFKEKCDFHISLYYNDDWFVEGMDYWTNREVTSTKVNPSITSHEFVIRDWEGKNIGAHKVMCMGETEEIEKLFNWLGSNFSNELNLYRSKPTYIEITPSVVSKATAVSMITKYLNISEAQAIAVGDNYNDLEMLKSVGLGISMGNAPDSVKAAAAHITLSNNEDGLAEAIRKYFK